MKRHSAKSQPLRRRTAKSPAGSRPSPQSRPKDTAPEGISAAQKYAPLPDHKTDEVPAGTESSVQPADPPGETPQPDDMESPADSELTQMPGNFGSRIFAAQDRLKNQAGSRQQLEALLDQAVTLLESISQHPAVRDYNATKRKLDEIEQRLESGGYPQ